MSVHLDYETKSSLDLTKVGAYRYVMDKYADCVLATMIFDDGEKIRWRPGQPCPERMRKHIEEGGEICAHNAAFERLVTWFIMVRKHGWPKPALRQFRCIAVTAAAQSLPRSLDRLGAALDLEIKKDSRGKALMKIHSIPTGHKPDGEPIWHEKHNDPVSLEQYHQYCDTDVATEIAAAKRLVPLSREEMEVYWLNETINDRGLRIDTQSAVAALHCIEEAKKRINHELITLTGGYVTAVTQTAALKAWIAAQGVELPTMDKDDVDEFLHDYDDLPDRVRRALELRQEGAKPSVEKIAAMLDRVCDDGRARGVYLHHGAGQTGRFSSRGVQAHNMPKYRKIFEDAIAKDGLKLRTLFDTIRTGSPDQLEFMYGHELGRPLHILSDAVRSFIWAAPGHEFINADYSSIEGRMAAWFAKEDWKVEAYEALDRGEGHGIYELAAAGIYGIDVSEVTKLHRPTGKVAELSCFTADTQVLTSNGVKRIVEVLDNDLVWDGIEWVQHQGVVARGVREVVSVAGTELTPDHLILTGQTWRLAQELVSNAKLLRQALATGSENLPLPASGSDLRAACAQSAFNARAARDLTRPISPISALVGVRAAANALSARAEPRESSTADTQTSCPTMSTAGGSSIGSQPAFNAAQTQKTPATLIMVGVALQSTGVAIVERFSSIWSHCLAGMFRDWSSIGLTLTGATSRETCVSSAIATTSSTNARRKTSKHESSNLKPVYDIVNAGPRNRFTVCSTSGFIIAHNCQYQTGVGGIKKFARSAKIKLPELYPALWSAAEEEQQAYAERRFEERSKQNDPNCTLLGREGWIAAELIKLGWRAKHPNIVQAWSALEEAAVQAVTNPGTVATTLFGRVRYIVRHGFLWCLLPSGRCLAYGAPKIQETEAPWADKTLPPAEREKKLSLTVLGTDAQTEKWIRFPIYGGSLFNNVVQGSARDILVNGLFKAEAAGYPIVLHTHDEMMAEVVKGFGDVKAFEQLICELPDWAAGLPLTASGWRGKRYRKD